MSMDLTKLSPRHKAAVRLRILGKKNDEIAEELSVSVRTLHEWFSQKIVKEELEEQLAKVDQEFASRLTSGAFKGLDALEKLVEQGMPTGQVDPETYLQLVKELLDRNPFTNPDYHKKNAQGPGGVVFNFNNLTNEQLQAKARELMSQAPKQLTDGADSG